MADSEYLFSFVGDVEGKKKRFNTEFTKERRLVSRLRRLVGRWWRWWRWWLYLQVRAHLIEFPLADSFDRQQILDAPESAALVAEIYDGLGSLGADARNLLKLLDIGDVQVQRMRRRLFLLSHHRAGADSYKNRDNHGVFHGSHCGSALTSSEVVDLSPIHH
jgi:hypothetical protein